MDVDFNPFSPEFRSDPYPIYHRLREQDRVSWMFDRWIVTGYAEVLTVLRDPRFRHVGSKEYLLQRFGQGPLYRMQSNWLLFIDPPAHTRQRGLVAKAFSRRSLDQLRPKIQAMVDSLLDAVEPRGFMDVIDDLAYPLAVGTLCNLLGVPTEAREPFKEWSRDIGPMMDPLVTPEQVGRANRGMQEWIDYFTELVEERRRDPRDDLITALVEAEERGDRLNHEELLAAITLVFGAGSETTMNLIGNGMLALLRHRDQLELLRSNPSLADNAVDELLRYDTSAQVSGRGASEDVQLGGKQIRAGQPVVVLLGAANRDPAQFPDPDRLDITRPNLRHLAFGGGPHFCVGAALGRIEAMIAFNTVLRRMPSIKLAVDEPEWRQMFTLRGLKALPVAF